MATAIHHGPPGSYKSFTLVQRFVIPALEAGRVVVSNIRGLNSIDRIIKEFPEIIFPDSADILFIDTKTQQGRYHMARWFHWVPIGALIIIDECQQIYPDRRDFKLESLDTYIPEPGQVIETISEGRPEDVFTAYDKQRHYNWDIFLTTTNIAKVKREIREVSEWAYRHRNTSGLLPWKKNTWIEHQHDPETSGKAESHRVGSPTEYKADERIYRCYESTATGDHSESQAGRSILDDPKVKMLLGAFVLCAVVFISLLVHKFTDKSGSELVEETIKNSVGGSGLGVNQNNDNARDNGYYGSNNKVDSYVITLDRATIIRFSYSGIEDSELHLFPKNCNINHHLMQCSISKFAKDLLLSSKDHYCIEDACYILMPLQRYQIKKESIEESESA